MHGTSALKEAILEAVGARADERKTGLLFSGGVDSTLIAKILQSLGKEFTCYTAALEGSQDRIWSSRVAKKMGLNHRLLEIDVVKYLPKVVKLLGEANIMNVGVAMPFYVCCEHASSEGVKVMFSGLGTEEIFAGYQRHYDALKEGGVKAFHKEIEKGLAEIWERDVKRDLKVSGAFGLELMTPFLDRNVIREGMKIPPEEKISELRKGPLREIARELGVPEEVCNRPKKAAQYGSGVEKEIRRLSREKGFKKWEITNFLQTFL